MASTALAQALRHLRPALARPLSTAKTGPTHSPLPPKIDLDGSSKPIAQPSQPVQPSQPIQPTLPPSLNGEDSAGPVSDPSLEQSGKKPASLFRSLQKKMEQEIQKMEQDVQDKIQNPKQDDGYLARMQAKIKAERESLEKSAAEKKDPSKVQDGKVQASPKRAVDTKLKRRIDEYLDLETNLKEREILLKKAFREGYWDDAKEIAKKGVKLWEAPKKMTPSHLAPRFFDVTAKTLAGNTTSIYELVPKASATLVTFVNSGIASEHIDTYIAPFVKEFGGNDKVQIVQIHAEDNWAKSVAMQLFLPSLRRRLVKEQWGKYLLCYKDISDDRRKIGISNRLLGWVHLVDSQCKLRWQAHGPATADETETLIESTKKLLERAERE